MTQFKVGDTVRIANCESGGFSSSYVGYTGTIETIDDTHLPVKVRFDHDNDYDWGRFSELELLDVRRGPDGSVKAKLALIEQLVAEVKELLG